MHWMLLPFRRYADFTGRSRRREFWMFTALELIFGVLLYAPLGLALTLSSGEPPAALGAVVPLLLVYIFAIFVPSLAVQVRRLHDQGRSGRLALLNLVPLIGNLIVLGFMLLEGTRGSNRYGADPRAGIGHDGPLAA